MGARSGQAAIHPFCPVSSHLIRQSGSHAAWNRYETSHLYLVKFSLVKGSIDPLSRQYRMGRFDVIWLKKFFFRQFVRLVIQPGREYWRTREQ
jgi:hypothetical protein